MEKTFDVEIITPDRVFYKGTADLLEFNTESTYNGTGTGACHDPSWG